MEFLKFLQSIRNPICDFLMATVTHLGEETLFMVIGMLFLWCIDKKRGYYILFAGFTGTVLIQFLKISFRIPRPWVLDPSFSIVEEARLEATGYSFPSGHTQCATTLYGGIACSEKRWTWLRYASIAAVILVAFSRMYLGVHTPKDVLVSFAVGVALIFILYPLMMREHKTPWVMYGTLIAVFLITLSNLLYVSLYHFPVDTDPENLEHAIESAWKLFGVVISMCLIYPIEKKFIRYETQAVWWAQILKLIGGLIPVLLIKILFKAPLQALLGPAVGDCVRYFLLVSCAGLLWPLTFRFFAKLGNKEKKTV